MEQFYLEDYLAAENHSRKGGDYSFEKLCKLINKDFLDEWDEQKENIRADLDIQKNAIIGHKKEVSFFKNKIIELLKKYGCCTDVPSWYKSLEDGIYHENWGLSGIAEWFGDGYKESSSAKVIGDRIYFMENGKMKLKKQRISKERREQLIRALLLLTPEERLDKNFHEIYMLDGTRVTIFGGAMVKEGQDVIIFRRYIIPTYTFEEQAERGTIPAEAVPLFKAMVGLGYNMAFTGAVRTAKTTFLSTWQSYEDKSLEGVMVETDPEIPLHKLMPDAPVVQVIADNDRLGSIVKNLLRSDADYMIMAEAREGAALDTAIKLAAKGSRRMKITYHTREPLNFPYDAACEIVGSLGGDVHFMARKVAASFDYVFHFVQLKDKSRKKLKSIHELSYDRSRDEILMKPVCEYDFQADKWQWRNVLGEDKRKAAAEEDALALEEFSNMLAGLGGSA
ncbi:MAG: CpaF/VirB11 family protein [Clostridiales bacterium]|nr:CpaF/VirB11 family protein [Clostridiales bacterium]